MPSSTRVPRMLLGILWSILLQGRSRRLSSQIWQYATERNTTRHVMKGKFNHCNICFTRAIYRFSIARTFLYTNVSHFNCHNNLIKYINWMSEIKIHISYFTCLKSWYSYNQMLDQPFYSWTSFVCVPPRIDHFLYY